MNWLLKQDQPAVRYVALSDLLSRGPKDPEVKRARFDVPKRGRASYILKLQRPDGRWEPKSSGTVLYGPKYTSTNWMALILSDLGLNKENHRISRTAGLFFREWMRQARLSTASEATASTIHSL